MEIRVGIPRALLYYNYFPAWKAFFSSLNIETVLSDPTTKEILDRGIKSAVDETCLPVKIAYGHLLNLCDKQVDYIFLPRVVSVEPRRYLCPKFLGLPDMAVSLIPGLPPLLAPEIDLHRDPNRWRKEMNKTAGVFRKPSAVREQAIAAAARAQLTYNNRLREGLTPMEALSGKRLSRQEGSLTVAVLGHAYNINDNFISMSLLHRLVDMGVRPITLEMLSEAEIVAGEREMEKEMFWTFGKETLGAANSLLKQAEIDGGMLLVSFGCGPDSLIKELIERRFRRARKPLLSLTIDEHTGEAGLITRVEAFLDMLEQKKAVQTCSG